jgi:hypothetical protein
MTTIIALSGRKQSGKTTLSNFIHGHEMKRHDIIDRFEISPTGDLIVNCTVSDDNGDVVEQMGVLDLNQNNDNFYDFASRRIWPLIKGYSFADSLKELCVSLFNIPLECVYGTDEQKNQIQEHLLWENMPGVITDAEFYNAVMKNHYGSNVRDVISKMTFHDPGPMTAREFMQFFGTNIMRKIYGPIWINNCLNRINSDGSAIAVISDCRFENEVKAIQAAGGKVVRLTRSVKEDSHISEVELDGYEGFDFILDNQNISIEESCSEFLKLMIKLGVTQKINTGRYTTTIK